MDQPALRGVSSYPGKPMVLAHRGRLPGFADNTVPAFIECGRLGADGVELDVRRSGDGALVVVHDPVVPDVGAVSDLTVAAMPEWVPLLDEALAACGAMTVNVEIKNDPSEPGFDGSGSLAVAVAQAISGREEQVMVSSFHRPTLDVIHSESPRMPTAWLAVHLDEADLGDLAGAGHSGVNLLHFSITPDLVASAHRRGLQVGAWTVDEPETMVQLAKWGVDLLITNRLELAREAMGAWVTGIGS